MRLLCIPSSCFDGLNSYCSKYVIDTDIGLTLLLRGLMLIVEGSNHFRFRSRILWLRSVVGMCYDYVIIILVFDCFEGLSWIGLLQA